MKKLFFLTCFLFFNLTTCWSQGTHDLQQSEYVTIIITVPESHADLLRKVMAHAGAGKIGDYSYCSFSAKGIGRFMPNQGSNPYLGKENILEEVPEERIETVCSRNVLHHVIEEIKKAHPYEETVIEIYPVYEIGRKTNGG